MIEWCCVLTNSFTTPTYSFWKLPRPKPGQPGLFLRPWLCIIVVNFCFIMLPRQFTPVSYNLLKWPWVTCKVSGRMWTHQKVSNQCSLEWIILEEQDIRWCAYPPLSWNLLDSPDLRTQAIVIFFGIASYSAELQMQTITVRDSWACLRPYKSLNSGLTPSYVIAEISYIANEYSQHVLIRFMGVWSKGVTWPWW